MRDRAEKMQDSLVNNEGMVLVSFCLFIQQGGLNDRFNDLEFLDARDGSLKCRTFTCQG